MELVSLLAQLTDVGRATLGSHFVTREHRHLSTPVMGAGFPPSKTAVHRCPLGRTKINPIKAERRETSEDGLGLFLYD